MENQEKEIEKIVRSLKKRIPKIWKDKWFIEIIIWADNDFDVCIKHGTGNYHQIVGFSKKLGGYFYGKLKMDSDFGELLCFKKL